MTGNLPVRRVGVLVLLGVVVGALAPAGVRAQDRPAPAPVLDRDYYRRPYPQLVKPRPAALLFNQLTESEPNDDFMAADPIVLGDTVGGFVDPAGDVDYFAVDLTAGERVDFDIDAFTQGSALDAVLRLYDTDGVSLIDFSDDVIGRDSRLVYQPTVGGRYFVSVTDAAGAGGAGFFYILKATVVATGPADPTTFFALGLGGPLGVAAVPGGGFYVVDNTGVQVLRVDAQGGSTRLADLATTGGGPNVDVVRDLVVDGFGNVLAVGREDVFRSVIWRITPAGAVSEFFVGPNNESFFSAITVDRAGGVWLADEIQQSGTRPEVIVHFDPLGTPLEIFDVSAAGSDIFDLAFSPAGELHFTNVFGDVYKLIDGGTPVPVIQRTGFSEGIAFDGAGNLYLGDGSVGRVLLYDAGYTLINDPYAGTNLAGPLNLAFGLRADGTPSADLFVLNFGIGLPPPFAGAMMQLGPVARPRGYLVSDFLVVATDSLRDARVGTSYGDTLRVAGQAGSVTWSVLAGELPTGLSLAPGTGVLSGVVTAVGLFPLTIKVEDGVRVGFRDLSIRTSSNVTAPAVVANALFGLTTLPAAEVQAIDQAGNGNGALDIGDLRAQVRASGRLPGAARVPLAYHEVDR